MPCKSGSGFSHTTSLPTRFAYNDTPFFRAVATFCDETQFNLRKAKAHDYGRTWPIGKDQFVARQLFKCSFEELIKVNEAEQGSISDANSIQIMHTSFEELLRTDQECDELFALEYITIYGKWGMPETFTIIDSPGYSLSTVQVLTHSITIDSRNF